MNSGLYRPLGVAPDHEVLGVKGFGTVTCVVGLYFVMFLADMSWSVGNLSCYSTLDLLKNANGGFLKVILFLYNIFMWQSYTRHDLAWHPVKIEVSISLLIKSGTKY